MQASLDAASPAWRAEWRVSGARAARVACVMSVPGVVTAHVGEGRADGVALSSSSGAKRALALLHAACGIRSERDAGGTSRVRLWRTLWWSQRRWARQGLGGVGEGRERRGAAASSSSLVSVLVSASGRGRREREGGRAVGRSGMTRRDGSINHVM
jgi:hypothetical protein